jgi:hypothetical protein
MEPDTFLAKAYVPHFETSLIDEILAGYETTIGRHFAGYRNHVLRVVQLCELLSPLSDVDRRHVQIAACFHDLAIFTHKTLDYLGPSRSLALQYLESQQKGAWAKTVVRLIDEHHKLLRSAHPVANSFRKADWIDVSWGALKFGVPRERIAALQERHPSAGFHVLLVQLSLKRMLTRPWNPLPMLRW